MTKSLANEFILKSGFRIILERLQRDYQGGIETNGTVITIDPGSLPLNVARALKRKLEDSDKEGLFEIRFGVITP